MQNLLNIKFYLTIAFVICSLNAYSQKTPNDCENYIQICDNRDINLDVSGPGKKVELSSIHGCMGNVNDTNEIWFKVTIEQAGKMSFVIAPTSLDLNEDYDFWVFGPNQDCDHRTESIRCSTTNPNNAHLSYNTTGLRDNETDYHEGPAADGNSYVKSIDVLAGETYLIIINRAIGSNAFSFKWTGTAVIQNPFSKQNFGNFPDLVFCDDGSGSVSCDFSTYSAAYLGAAAANFSLSYYGNITDATIENNPILLPRNVHNGEKYYVRISSKNSECFETREILIKITPKFTNINKIICDNDEFYFKGKRLTTSGIYTDSLKSKTGCDSIIVLNLTVNRTYNVVFDDTICDGQIYNLHNFNANKSGTYTQRLKTTCCTCDSIITLNLFVKQKPHTIINASICQGSTYTENNFNVNAAGTYTQTHTADNGCDSIVTLNLTINKTYERTIIADICDGMSYTDKNFNENTTNIYYSRHNTINGCDSTIILDLRVHPKYNEYITETIYEDENINIGNSTFDKTGIYSIPLQTAFKCDSTITLDLNVLKYPEITAFSPFNNDGINDYFLPGFKIQIFNRYGTLIYETKTEEQQKLGWNGYNTHGAMVEPGVYFYILYSRKGTPFLRSSVEVLKR